MAQPLAGYQWTNVGTVGTIVLKDTQATLVRVVIPGTYVGTIKLDDAASTSGTTATSNIFTLGLPASSIPQSIELGISCKKGLIYQSTGTPAATLVWD